MVLVFCLWLLSSERTLARRFILHSARVRDRLAGLAGRTAPRYRRALFLHCAADHVLRSLERRAAAWAAGSADLAVGGILVTIVVATVGIVGSLPLGILLALGRRSAMPAVRLLSVTFIEFVRGVPLITVLFMASVMLPLFVPER